jgi:hypothetical protein
MPDPRDSQPPVPMQITGPILAESQERYAQERRQDNHFHPQTSSKLLPEWPDN